MKWYFTAFIFIQSLIFNKIEAFENLARPGGTAKQSSNYSSYHASKAIDGNINQNWDGGSCSHTAINRRTAWWRLDIGQQANIYNIVIYYRKLTHYRLDGFYIHISDTFDEQHPNSGHLCFHDQQDGYANTLQNITCDYHGRYVVIYNQRNSTDAFLELCEVEVYGCILGRYGNACTYGCSTHCNGTTCDIKTGHCVCALGYRGQKCTKTCSEGRYGVNCSETCSNCEHRACNPVSGVCQYSCKPGWKGDKCTQECNTGYYGPRCLTKCGKCEGNNCSRFNGSCTNCLPGWKGQRCDKLCDKWSFGEGCRSICHCLNRARCNNVNGQCPNGDCDSGWKPRTCSETCGKGTYGLNCNTSCNNCLSGTCDNVEGLCKIKDECKPGYLGSRCDQVIQEKSSSGFYAAIGGMAGAMTVLFITVIILGTLLFRRNKGGTRNEISNRSDNNDGMSSLNRKTNAMYEDIREGTSDTRNEDLQQKGGNTSTANYEILAMQDIPNTSGGLSSEQEQRQSESTTEQYETLGEQDKTNVYEEIKNKQEPEDRQYMNLKI